jgi:hypothetical protein
MEREIFLRAIANMRPRAPKAQTPPKPECYVILGRHGDIVNILPVFRDLAIKTSSPVSVVVSTECAPLFDGTSYINPVIVNLSCDQLAKAEEFARTKYNVIRTVQVWGDNQARVNSMPHYNENAWLMAGRIADFKRFELRPVFDSRSPAREAQWMSKFVRGGKPILLLAARGGNSSPFADYENVSRSIISTFTSQFEIIDLDLLRAHRIYDIVGLMEKSSVLVTADSVHMHLAAACSIPTVAMLSNRNYWAETSPRCRVVWKGNYLVAQRSLAQIHEIIRRCTAIPPGGEPKIIHVTDSYYRNHISEPRHSQAFASWLNAGWLEAHLPEPPARNGLSVGCQRPLPFMKDILACGLNNARPDDIVVWTNSDTVVDSKIAGAIRKAMKQTPMTTCRRVDSSTGKPAPGRDLAAFTAAWLKDHWMEIPDFLCGAAELDNWMALESRRIIGKKSTAKDLFTDLYPADIPYGMVKHVAHGTPPWDRDGARYTDQGNLYNLKLFKDWCSRWRTPVAFDLHGHIDWKI